jgi:hypothetical protein
VLAIRGSLDCPDAQPIVQLHGRDTKPESIDRAVVCGTLVELDEVRNGAYGSVLASALVLRPSAFEAAAELLAQLLQVRPGRLNGALRTGGAVGRSTGPRPEAWTI